MIELELWQWILGAGAALLVGISKTGMPGFGILVVILLANVFGGRPSVGIMLPMLIFADIFAVAWYRRHARWDKLIGLLPWVIIGMAVGSGALWLTGRIESERDILGLVIGILVLAMLAVYLLQRQLNITPKSKAGIVSTGTVAGFATTVSNAAGPVMSVYLAAHRLPKEEFIGTFAWYFFIINLSKLPIYILLTAMNPDNPIITGESLTFNLATFPAILVGVFAGRWLLRRVPQRLFDIAILGLAAASAIKLIIG